MRVMRTRKLEEAIKPLPQTQIASPSEAITFALFYWINLLLRRAQSSAIQAFNQNNLWSQHRKSSAARSSKWLFMPQYPAGHEVKNLFLFKLKSSLSSIPEPNQPLAILTTNSYMITNSFNPAKMFLIQRPE